MSERRKRLTLDELDALVEAAREDVEAAHDAASVLNVAFWDCSDSETLTHTDIDEAIEDYLDACWPDCPEGSLTVTGYRLMTLGENEPDDERLLEDIYERLDEEYGNPDGDPSEITEAVRDAARALCAVVRREYRPWMCEGVVSVEVSAGRLKAIHADMLAESSK